MRAPSISAASTSSRGTACTNTPIIHSPSGRFSVVWARISPRCVLSIPTERAIAYQAPASVMGGTMWNTTAQPSTAASTQRGQRIRCSE